MGNCVHTCCPHEIIDNNSHSSNSSILTVIHDTLYNIVYTYPSELPSLTADCDVYDYLEESFDYCMPEHTTEKNAYALMYTSTMTHHGRVYSIPLPLVMDQLPFWKIRNNVNTIITNSNTNTGNILTTNSISNSDNRSSESSVIVNPLVSATNSICGDYEIAVSPNVHTSILSAPNNRSLDDIV